MSVSVLQTEDKFIFFIHLILKTVPSKSGFFVGKQIITVFANLISCYSKGFYTLLMNLGIPKRQCYFTAC